MTINRLNQGTTNQVLVKAISGQTTNLLELQDSSGNVVSSIGPTGALGGTVSQPQGLVHIKTEPIGVTVASVTVDDVFTTTFDTYKLFFNVRTSNDTWLDFRFRNSSGDYTSTDYMHRYFQVKASLSSFEERSGTRFRPFSPSNGDVLTIRPEQVCEMTIMNPMQSFRTSFASGPGGGDGGGVLGVSFAAGNMKVTTAFSGFKIFPDGGTISGGFVKVFGVIN
jgi:hypothetical protein